MNSLIIFEHEIHQNKIVIEDQHRLTHLHNVLKAQIDQTYKVTLLDQGLARAKLLELTSKRAQFKIESYSEKEETPDWHVIVGLSRPPTMKKVLEHGASLGIKHFHFFPAAMSEKSYADSKIWSDGKAEQCLYDGLSQSAYYWQMPQIHHYKRLNELPVFEHFDRRLLSLVHQQTASMKKIDAQQSLALAFGPERGWSTEEDETLRRLGFQAVRLAPTTLRVEIAVFATLGQCHLLL